MDLVIGTHSEGKGRELRELLGPFGFNIKTLQEFDSPLHVVEDGDSFEANARLKACQQSVHLGHWVLADDSGLEVDALQGAPGIYSARYSGDSATDADNNAKLLQELTGVPASKRGAQYYCHVVLSNPLGEIQLESSGTCRGSIRTESVGSNGFGYDPLFEVVEYHRTFGELGPAVKRVLSHRARAMRGIAPKLIALAQSGNW